jgi:Cu+-exporting ATPase
MADATCIVCGKSFDAEKVDYKIQHGGNWYHFNDLGCRNRFLGNPKKYLEPAESASA